MNRNTSEGPFVKNWKPTLLLIVLLSLSLSLSPPLSMAQETAKPQEEEAPTTEVQDKVEAPVESPKPPPKVKSKIPRLYAAAVNLAFPDLLPLDFFYFPNKQWAVRFYLTPPLLLGAKLLMDADSTTLNSRLKVATPEAEVDLKIRYGPAFGMDALFFPWQGSLYAFGGLSYRRLQVKAQDSEPLYVCFVVAEIPCDQSHSFLTSSSSINVDAEYTSTSIAARAGAGWIWRLPGRLFLNFAAGLTKPIITKRSVSVVVSTDDTAKAEGADPGVKDGLNNLKSRKESQLEAKAVSIAQQFDQSLLPILSVGLGYSF